MLTSWQFAASLSVATGNACVLLPTCALPRCHITQMPCIQAASRAEAAQIVEFLNAGGSFDGVDVAVFPSAIHAESARAGLRKDVYVGAQDVFTAKGYGAFTGEHTAEVLLDAGLSSVIVGHSERRHIIGESNALSGEKARVALAAGLTVVFCVGETLAEREVRPYLRPSSVDSCSKSTQLRCCYK